MERIERVREEIRSNWFKNHVATITKHEGITILDWKEPGTLRYAVKYVMIGNKLFVGGDIGDAVYNLTWHAAPESFEDINIYYLQEKLTCSSRAEWDFNSEIAQKEIEEYFIDSFDISHLDELEEEDAELYEDLISATVDWSTHEQYSTMGVWTVYHNTSVEWFDGETAEYIADFGKELSSVFIAYLLGIQMANEQLKKEVSV